MFDRPVRDAKPTSWFGGSFEGAKKWLASKGSDYYVDYCTWVDEQEEYYVAATKDPELAATQVIFFTVCFPLSDPALLAHSKLCQYVQIAGGPDGWISVFGPPVDPADSLCQVTPNFPHELIESKLKEGLYLRCIRFVPDDAPQ